MKATGIIFIVLAAVLFAGTAMAITLDEAPIPTPEPATIVLLSAGMIGLGIFGKKIKNRKHDDNDVRDLILNKTKGGFAMARKNFLGKSVFCKSVYIFVAFSALVLLGGVFSSARAGEGIITTIAGNGNFGFSGDGGPAINAQLYHPENVAVDNSGNLYINDWNNNRIRKVDTSGNISTVTGSSALGFSGDGGPATSAQLNNPRGIAVDSSGNLYIADGSNHRIRKVDTSGKISTVAGSGAFGYDKGGFSGDGGPATSAQLNTPYDVAVDNNGNLYIADMYNHRIRKVDTAGKISTVAGNGNVGFSGDGGPAINAQFNWPRTIAIDTSGNLYIADWVNNRVRKVDKTSGIITTVAGNGTQGFSGDGGPATSAQLVAVGIAFDSRDNLYIADSSNALIRKVDKLTGNISTVAGTTQGFSGDGGPASRAQFYGPFDVAVDRSGNLYIADGSNFRIRKVAFTNSLPDTGQAKCYNDTVEILCPQPGEDYYGQDAQYIGNQPSYTKLDANGKALPDSAATWTMVKDNVTDLIWEAKQAKDGVANYSNPHDADNTYTWYNSDPATNGGNPGTPGNGTDTEDFINALNTANFGGFSDWRLPTVNELFSIVNFGNTDIAINQKYFLNVYAALYWTSTIESVNPDFMTWCIQFLHGDIYFSSKNNSLYIRAVRGVSNSSSNSLVNNGNGTVTDKNTGLMWQQTHNSTRLNWKDAHAYCESLSLSGYDDWRLPNMFELFSLVDNTRSGPATYTSYFPDTPWWGEYDTVNFVSSTTDTNNPSLAWSISFHWGSRGMVSKINPYYVRCVRGIQSPSPTITAVTPNIGSIVGGTNVTITGTNFITGSKSVTFGGIAATNVTVNSTTSLTCTTPANTAGAKDVVVTIAGLSATKAGGFTYSASITRIINLSPISLDFGNVTTGAPTTRTLTISNTGNSPLSVSSITYPHGFFGNWSGTIPEGGSQEITVTFAPSVTQMYSGTIIVNSDKIDGINTMAVTGTGTGACVTQNVWGIDNDNTADLFGDDWGSHNLQVYLKNTPNLSEILNFYFKARATEVKINNDLFGVEVGVNGVGGHRDYFGTWSYVHITGTDFKWYTLSLPADLNNDGIIDWKAGVNNVNITCWSSYNNIWPSKTGVDMIYLDGDGRISLTGDLDFGNVSIGSTVTRTLTIKNTGTTPLTVSSITYPAGFSGNWSGTILACDSKDITVTFTPSAAQSYGGVLTVNSNKTDGINTMTISGMGYQDYPPVFCSKWGSEGNGDGQFSYPADVEIDNQGYVYVVDLNNSRVQKFDRNGNFITKWGSYGDGNNQFISPWRIAVDNSGNVYVSDGGAFVRKFTSNGVFITKWGGIGSGNGQFDGPWLGMGIDKAGNVYVSDTSNNRIQKFTNNGNFLSKWGSYGTDDGQFDHPSDVHADSYGNVYVVDRQNHRIQKFDANGNFIIKWGVYGSGKGQFNYPDVISIDSSDNVYVSDTGNSRIQKFSSNGNFLCEWGTQGSENGQFIGGRAEVGSDGIVYVADWANHRVQKFCYNPITIPTLTTDPVISITQSTAISGGNVTSDGGSPVTEKGVCWSTSQNPTTSDSKTANGTGIGIFTSSLTGLTANITYYVRAYAINSAGTAYGNQVSFKSTPQTYTVTFQAGTGGTISPAAPQTVASGGSTTAVTATANSGYAFINWTNQSGSVVSTSATLPAQIITSNMTYTANFQQIPNTAPVASDGSLTATSGVSANGTLTATDANGDTLTYSIVTQPTKGTILPNPVYPNFKYTPNAGVTGTDSFTFKANDAKADSNIATITILISPQPGFRVWIDKNGNGAYDAGEEVSGAAVRINSETADRGITDNQGIIQLQNITNDAKIYAQKIFYSMSNPKAVDSNFANNRNQNPYYAGSVNGKMYDFVMASDIRISDGTYYDFPGQGKTLTNAAKDSQGNTLIQLVHPKIEWNLLVAFEEAQSADFYNKIRAGFKSYADYMYNFTDGYSVVKNVVLIKGAYKDSAQWNFCDVQVKNTEWPNAAIFGNRGNWSANIRMGKTWSADPDGYNWYSALGHESGHYLLGFGDEYMNANYTKNYYVFEGAASWTYRRSHDGDAGEPNEFPRNYGIMDYPYTAHEMSDPTDYFPRAYPSPDTDLVTHEFAIRQGQSCWSFFKSFYQNDIKQQMAANGITGFSDAFFNNLIIPPHTAGSYPTSDSTKRSGPSAMNRDVVSFIDWTMPGATRGDIAEDVFDALAWVTDESGAAVANADVWLASSDRKSFQGRTDESGVVKCGSIFIGKRLEAYSDGRKAELVIDAIRDQYVLVLPLLNNKRDNTSGIVISAMPDMSASKRLNLTISGNALSSAPSVNLSQSHGYSANIAMSASGTNQYSGIADYQYNSGILQVTSGGSQSASPFEIFSTDLAPASGFYAPNGELEMAYSKSSFTSSGTLVIVNSSAPAPPNNGLIQVGNVYSFGFSGGTLKDVILRIRLSSGVNRSQLNLYGWDIQNKAWILIQGGESDLKYFTISLASLSYVSYGLFSVPQANDPNPPNPVTGLTASTGTSRWGVSLQWTAPSDNTGVFAYDIRFNTVPITESNWNSSIQINDAPKPASSGTVQSMVVEMPDPNTEYYFGIKAIDAAGNMSALTTLTSPVNSSNPDCTTSSVPGDLDCDCRVDLSDAIIALKILSAIDPTSEFCRNDVNGDNRIGLEEVIYILQKVAGLR